MLRFGHDLKGMASRPDSISILYLPGRIALPASAGNTLRVVHLTPDHAAACESIGRSLPDWFGIEDGLADLRRCAEEEPGFVAVLGDDIVGFLTLNQHFPETIEITWMAVSPNVHRQGIGQALIETAVTEARATGTRYLHVKTLADLHPSPEYAQTRAFYEAMGFSRLIVLPELWGPNNPCLLMVRAI